MPKAQQAPSFSFEDGVVRVVARSFDGAKSPLGVPSLEVAVLDTGIGIDPHEHELIFDEFRQAESTGSGRGGTGLGLALVRRLCELHGGTVSLRSTPGEGSTFTVVLPLEQSQR